ncbi:MAG: hypothetical protein FWG07_11360 [Treponema sp.]|nr:hypothetical protein [Treponema sp.]
MRNKAKKILSILLFLAVILAGCNKTINEVMESFGDNKSAEDHNFDNEWKAVKLDNEIRYFNNYLGFSYAIPKGWWLYSVNEENLGNSRSDIGDIIFMDFYYGNFKEYSYSVAWLMAFGNLEKPDQDNHLGYDLDVRFIDGISDMPGYMEYMEKYMMEPEDDEEYKIMDSQKITINGKSFELRDYLVTLADYRDYYILTLSCQIKNNYFLNIAVDYWADNTKAKDAIMESIIKSVEFF